LYDAIDQRAGGVERDHECAVNSAAQLLSTQHAITVCSALDAADEQRIISGSQGLLNSAENLHVEVLGNERNQNFERLRSAARERARDRVWMETKLVRNGEDACTGVVGDVWVAIECARRGTNTDAGCPRNILNGDHPAVRFTRDPNLRVDELTVIVRGG
jgi:hypothetical protein